MKPWDTQTKAGKKPTDEFLIPLWADFKPKDFYFAIQWHDDVEATVIYMVPVDYYDLHNKMLNDSMPIVHLLPAYFEETIECIYEADAIPVERVVHDLTSRGFSHNYFFQQYIDKNNGIFGL